MIIVRLKGGLGNQMFQYALGRVLSLKNNTDLKLDISFFNLNFKNITKRNYDLNVFNINANLATRYDIPFLFRLHNNKFITRSLDFIRRLIRHKGQEKSFRFDPDICNLDKNVYLDGYWQSFKYFNGYEDVIRKDFTLNKDLPDNIKKLKKEIESSNSLCVHIRRGDYVGNAHHEVVNIDYYKNGIAIISNKTIIDKIYVFSDDIKWCEENIKFDLPTMFVGEEYSGENAEGHLILMSACKNFVICNSSFSWWGAWFNQNKDKIVVAPKKWFNDQIINTSDLVPENWIRI